MKPSVFTPQIQILKKTPHQPVARRHHNPISPLSHPPNSRSERKRAIQAGNAPSLFTNIPRAIPPPPTVSEWLRSDRKWATLWAFFCLISDPLQRDAHQVHLPATQRILAAHHASEQRGRSLQLPRYGHEVTNYHTHMLLLPFLYLPVAASKKTGGETGRQRQRENYTHTRERVYPNLLESYFSFLHTVLYTQP